MMHVNSARLWQRHMTLAEIGATPKGGNNRQALTDEDILARKQFIAWCEAAGCKVRIDQIGNIFARREGLNPSLAPVMTGSHLDTQPTGGRFDGVYGVLAGLEVIETLNDHGITTDTPVEVVVWCNEEGCRFTTAMMGSAVWSGNMPIADALALADPTGTTVADELARTQHAGTHPAEAFPAKAFVEAHIEQGPILELTDTVIGIVQGVQNMSRHEIVITGQEVHAGPTPMNMRKDPMRALAAFLPALYAMAEEQGEHARLTFGVIHASPASNNTVPGELRMTVDIRHPDARVYQSMVDSAYQLVHSACEVEQCPVEIRCFFEAPGVEFDRQCVGAVASAVTRLGYSHREMVSGAGHDACNVASVVPTAMIFVPCKGGISHNEAESAEPEHLEAGANVLLNALIELSTDKSGSAVHG